jgi:ABC-2 type transport system permease protein
MQGAGFTGAATGVNLARDIEQGWFDRLLLAPTPRPVLLLAIIASACLRALIPATLLTIVGLTFGAQWPGILALVIAFVLIAGLAAATACWSTTVALRFGTQQAAPLMQAVTFAAILLTPAYAPQDLLTGWLEEVAKYNPLTYVLEGIRQGFVGTVSWHDTWPAFVALAGVILVLGSFALRGLARIGK